MRVFSVLAILGSLLCIMTAAAQEDPSEVAAWSIILLHNLKDLLDDRYN